MKLSTPASGGYLTLNGALLGTSTTSDGSDYQSFVNVTSQVAAAGNGTYTAANVQASTGTNVYAGWALVVAYEAPGLPARNLTVFDGYASVNSGESAVTGSINGFVTPPTGTVNAKVGVVAYEGDLGFTGDSMSLDGNALSDAVNPSNNFFNSTISNLGTRVTAKTPNYVNQLGFDAKIVDASGFVPNGATGATFQLQTTNDQYFPGVVTTAINLYAPQVVSTKTATDLTNASGPVQPGDLIQYSMTVSNTGQDGANNVVLTDPIPANTQYVPGTLVVVSGANAGAKTDAAGDDQAEFNAGSNNVVFRLGTGANATTGGSLAIGASTTVTFEVRVNANTPDQTTVTNQATITAVGVTSGFPLTVLSSAASFLVHPLADLSLTKTVNNPTPNVGGTVTFTLNLANLGPSPATNVQVTDLLPSGLTFVSATPSQGTYNASTGLWTAGTITTASPQTLVINATVVSSAAQTNTATITHSDQSDPNAGNNTASATETPQQANLVLSKTVSNPTPNVGDTISFTLALRNTGPNTATNVQVTDPLPAGLTFVSATASQGTYNSTTGVWTVGTVDVAGGVRNLVINATVVSPAAQTNTATITHSDQFDPNTANTIATATETPQQADLVLSKTVDNPTPNVGATINYTITLADNGPDSGHERPGDRCPAVVRPVRRRVPEPGDLQRRDGPLDRRHRRHDRAPLVAHPGAGDRPGLDGQHGDDHPLRPVRPQHREQYRFGRDLPATGRPVGDEDGEQPRPQRGRHDHLHGHADRQRAEQRHRRHPAGLAARRPHLRRRRARAGDLRPHHGDLDGGESGERLVHGPDRQRHGRQPEPVDQHGDDHPLRSIRPEPRQQHRVLGRHAAAGRPRPGQDRQQPDPQRGRYRHVHRDGAGRRPQQRDGGRGAGPPAGGPDVRLGHAEPGELQLGHGDLDGRERQPLDGPDARDPGDRREPESLVEYGDDQPRRPVRPQHGQ